MKQRPSSDALVPYLVVIVVFFVDLCY